MERARYYFSSQELKDQALRAWRTYAEDYRNLIPEYFRLLEEKKRIRESVPGCKQMPLRKLSNVTLKELVKIPFFDLETYEEAKIYADDLDYHGLNQLVATIHTALGSYSYVTIRAKIFDYKFEIDNCQSRKPAVAYDPNYPCKSGPRFNSKRSKKGIED